MSELLWSKITSMALLGGISLLLGVVPLKLRRFIDPNGKNSNNRNIKAEMALSALSCFGAGVILTTCVGHMLPETNMMLRDNIRTGAMPDTGKFECVSLCVVLCYVREG